MKKSRILIIGSFPKKNDKIYGGINKSCKILIDSKEFEKYEILTIDSSISNNSIPNLILRSVLSIKRFNKLIYYLLFNRPKTILIFCSDGLSAIEKGLMIWITNQFNISSMIFPRAGHLIEQVHKSKIFHFIIKYLFNYSSVFLSQGKNWSKFAENKLSIKRESIVEISNWTATRDLLEIGKKRLIKEKDTLKILFVGWLEKEKGVIEILKSLAQLNKENYRFNMYFIGDGSLMNYAQTFIHKNNLEEIVFLKGWKDLEELKEFYNLCDIFVLPSWKEGMPNSLIEALASGLPSIVSNVGVISNYLEHNFDTFFIEPKNQSALSNAIKKMITEINLRKKISKNSLMTAKNVFLENKSLRKLSELIDNQI
tara:strand:+ start:825 stop:1931 length:1107 start_codon:yes stop_codon:yes gene_type:complete